MPFACPQGMVYATKQLTSLSRPSVAERVSCEHGRVSPGRRAVWSGAVAISSNIDGVATGQSDVAIESASRLTPRDPVISTTGICALGGSDVERQVFPEVEQARLS